MSKSQNNGVTEVKRRIHRDQTLIPVQKLPILEERVTKQRMIDMMNNKDDIALDSFTLSLLCPISLLRIKTPVKGKYCKHMEPFDLASYYNLHSKASHWECPICMKFTPTRELVIDGFFDYLLKDVPSVCNEIELQKDGSWVEKTVKYEPDSPEKGIPKKVRETMIHRKRHNTILLEDCPIPIRAKALNFFIKEIKEEPADDDNLETSIENANVQSNDPDTCSENTVGDREAAVVSNEESESHGLESIAVNEDSYGHLPVDSENTVNETSNEGVEETFSPNSDVVNDLHIVNNNNTSNEDGDLNCSADSGDESSADSGDESSHNSESSKDIERERRKSTLAAKYADVSSCSDSESDDEFDIYETEENDQEEIVENVIDSQVAQIRSEPDYNCEKENQPNTNDEELENKEAQASMNNTLRSPYERIAKRRSSMKMEVFSQTSQLSQTTLLNHDFTRTPRQVLNGLSNARLLKNHYLTDTNSSAQEIAKTHRYVLRKKIEMIHIPQQIRAKVPLNVVNKEEICISDYYIHMKIPNELQNEVITIDD